MASGILENDNLFVVGKPAWHGFGTVLNNPPTCAEALRISKLDWSVEKVELYAGNKVVEDYIANIRSDTNDVLGIVTPKYHIVQNIDAFDFVDDIMSNEEYECTYESAGSLFGGKRVWILARMPNKKILDEDVASYMFFSNSHDGKSSLKCGVTNVQICCNNTLQLAINSAPRVWSMRHMSSIDEKKREAMQTLKFASTYIEAFNVRAEKLANKKFNIDKFLDVYLPLDDLTERVKRNTEQTRNYIKNVHDTKDYIGNIKNTAWGCYQAFTDWSSNADPLRASDTYAEKKLVSFFDGSVDYDKVQNILEA